MRFFPRSLGLSVLVFIGVTSGALAQATINDCEKIQAADAYNQCLAKFGPSGKDLNVEPPKAGDMKGSSADAAATAGRPSIGGGRHAGRHRGGSARRGHGGGRKRAVFTVHRRHH